LERKPAIKPTSWWRVFTTLKAMSQDMMTAMMTIHQYRFRRMRMTSSNGRMISPSGGGRRRHSLTGSPKAKQAVEHPTGYRDSSQFLDDPRSLTASDPGPKWHPSQGRGASAPGREGP